MHRTGLKIIAVLSYATLLLLLVAALGGLRWSVGVHGRSGDLLLGVHPGQVRVGWSQDWTNSTGWAHVRADRSRSGPAFGLLGGQIFTTAAPHEMAIDTPVWLVAVPLIVILLLTRRAQAALPDVPSCPVCGYLVGTSSFCTECGAALGRKPS